MNRITWEISSSSPSKPQFLSQRPSIDNVSGTVNNSLLNKSNDRLNTSLSSSSNRRTGGIPWGVTPKENRFETTYSKNYGMYDSNRSGSKRQDAFSPSHSLSDTLIPFDLHTQKRISKVGDFNAAVLQRRVQTEGETFFDKVGERPQQPLKRGLLKLDESRPVDHALRNEHRFYRQIEPDHGVSTRKLSPSRVVKNVLDYSPPANLSGGAGSVTRNNESLAFNRDLSPGYKELIGKVGVSYSSVLSRVKENKPRTKRFSPKKPADYDMKGLLSNSFVDSREMSPAHNEPKPSRKGIGSHNYEKPTFSSFYSGKINLLTRENQKLNQSYDFSNHKRSNSSDRFLLQKDRVTDVFDVNKISKVEEKRDGRSRSSYSNQSIQNKLTNNTSLMSWMSVIKERSRSNSTQSLKEALKGTGIKRSSIVIKPSPVVVEKSASPEKHVSTVVIHEKKKPTRGGMFGNPIINKNFVQKMLEKSTKQQRSITPPKWK